MKTIEAQSLVNRNVTLNNPEFIIGVGASAGGLDALLSLFKTEIPANTSFIILQHLPKDYKSDTSSLISSNSHLNVMNIEDNMVIEPNTIYVLSEKKGLSIENGRFIISGKAPDEQALLINEFLFSLANFMGTNSLAIILSGANDDGTLGAGAIKKAGGTVIVQDPNSTEWSKMPGSVIDSGLADAVLQPEDIMAEVFAYTKQSALLSEFNQQNEDWFLEILDLIHLHSAIDFTQYKRPTITRRIARRMLQKEVDGIKDYVQLLKNDPEELNLLAENFLINVTKFFRDSKAFDILNEKVFPEIIAEKSKEEVLKLWVVGCATGEEAYSLAILILECFEKLGKTCDVKIFASDVDEKVLKIASKGIYHESISKDVKGDLLFKYFYKEKNNYKVKEKLRDMVIFTHHDITKHPPYFKLDLISCRNLLIYLSPLMQKKILATFHFSLNREGYLFLGPSEDVGTLKPSIRVINEKWKIYKNEKLPQNAEMLNFNVPKRFKQIYQTPPVEKRSKKAVLGNLCNAVNESLLEEFSCAGVCVDEQFNITQTFGDFFKFIIPEKFNFSLLEMLPKELAVATGISLRQVLKDNTEADVKRITFQQQGHLRMVNVKVKPILVNSLNPRTFLVLFREIKTDIENKEISVKEYDLEAADYISHLEAENRDYKENINELDEKLQDCVENAQLYSEELVSTNEELQSTNEEAQAINEELQTVNSQLKEKVKEIGFLNDELNSYFTSTLATQIYVDEKLIIRKFTPAAITQININESDIGRPISDISTNIKFSTFMEDIKSVLNNGESIFKDIETENNLWYQMNVMPYKRKGSNTIDGVIITFNNITEIKTIQKNLEKLNEDHKTFIYSASHDLKAPLANVAGLVSALNKEIQPNNKKVEELIAMLDESARQLNAIITELSDITKAEEEVSRHSHDSIDVEKMFKEVKTSIQHLIKESKAEIIPDFEVKSIKFSKKYLRSILLNLLTNAIKYKSPERSPLIKIKTRQQDGFVLLTIQDNGKGIKEDDKVTLFTKFTRTSSASGVEGTGIGLYLMKRIIEMTGGSIEMESVVGKGSTFKVLFKSNTNEDFS